MASSPSHLEFVLGGGPRGPRVRLVSRFCSSFTSWTRRSFKKLRGLANLFNADDVDIFADDESESPRLACTRILARY